MAKITRKRLLGGSRRNRRTARRQDRRKHRRTRRHSRRVARRVARRHSRRHRQRGGAPVAPVYRDPTVPVDNPVIPPDAPLGGTGALHPAGAQFLNGLKSFCEHIIPNDASKLPPLRRGRHDNEGPALNK